MVLMSRVKADGVDDRLDGVFDGRIIRGVGEFQGNAVAPVHPGIGDIDAARGFRPGIEHFHAVDRDVSGCCLIPGQDLKCLGHFSLVGNIAQNGQLISMPVKAEVRTVISRLLHKLIREFHGETARIAGPRRKNHGRITVYSILRI